MSDGETDKDLVPEQKDEMEKRKQIKVRWTGLGRLSRLELRPNITIVTLNPKNCEAQAAWGFWLAKSEIKDVDQFPHFTTRTTFKYITWGNLWDTLYTNLCLWRMPSDKMVQLVEKTTQSFWATHDELNVMSKKKTRRISVYLKFSIII